MPICLWVSSWFGNGVIASSIVLMVATALYNEGNGGGRHWFIKNALNGIGFASFESGAVLIAGKNRDSFDLISVRAVLITYWLFATTTHAQDFKDIEGDKESNRSTIPIDFPRASRPSMICGLLFWSIASSKIWNIGDMNSILLILLGAYVGARYCLLQGRRNDQVSFYWYNVSQARRRMLL